MSLSDRLHTTDETESPLPPTGEDAVAEPPFAYPARTAEQQPASRTAAVDTVETPGSRVDEPEAGARNDEPLDETPADKNAGATPFGEPVAVAPAAPFDEPVIVNSSDHEAPPADEPVAAAAPVDEAVVPSDSYGDEHVVAPVETDPVDGTDPIDARASAPPVGLGTTAGDSRVDEPVADDFVAGPPDGPAVAVAAATGTGTGTGTGGPEQPAAGGKEAPGDWRQVLMEFVDHPREAVEKADQLVEDAVRALTEQINREHTGLRDAWRTHGEPSTEDLRKALRGYRDFFEKVLSNR
ncbi:hypothetical protein [Pseudofrankia inefficax]|uniref:Uncharacterized protein n=1 Tax=Pseudofrankia inefficax (strain DSM 45817 / CECT 9037 / DDB 130130 / EuI1c) TaxID=298654 RepID=E3J6S0_PSEI1|nr:hypothetical protein [Pseudofrankia inefficax]ADP81994.1 hypothetical protein FraEuI1c_3989 [Pseudofrankia inefficax]